MCKCNGETYLGVIGMARPALTNNSYIYIEGKNLQIVNDDPRKPTVNIPISFCPLCGRKLTESARSQSA